MTQRIFDIENEKDTQDLWDILPDWADKITKREKENEYDIIRNIAFDAGHRCLLKINWHDATEITRPIKEATEQDIGKICMFFNSLSNSKYYGVLIELRETVAGTRYVAQSCNGTHSFVNAYRLTKQEIEELC